MGQWPCPGKINASTDMFGGLPQINITAHLPVHLAALASDIARHIPDAGFAGVAVLDFECFGPLWAQVNASSIGTRSVELVRVQHPSWTKPRLEAEARTQYEAAARAYYEHSLHVVRRVRPQGSWGFYGYPLGYTRHSGDFLARALNDQLGWLLNASTAWYPCTYLAGRANKF